MNNYERIKAMTKDEMFRFLLRFEAGDIDYAKTFCGDMFCTNGNCDDCLRWWLDNDSKAPQGLDYYGSIEA